VNCEDLRDLLHGYADGELDLVHSLEVERHLHGCSACSGALAGQRTLRQALRDPALYHRPPSGLQGRIRSSLLRARQPRAALPALPWRALGIAASLAVVALLAWGGVRVRSLRPAEDVVEQQVVSSHIRSLMPHHLLDVASPDEQVVGAFLTRHLDFKAPVKNWEDEGYPLAGGRLDYLDDRRVAALVYERRPHVINLFICPANVEVEEPTRSLTRRGFHVVYWTRGGLTWWAISDLTENELREFVGLIRR
jgi:anti-sigma factor RsiW